MEEKTIEKLEISLIIPVYNDTVGLINLLKSIDNGNFFKEIIIIDDQSDHNYFVELENYTKYIDNIILLKNNTGKKGAGTCRNIGISVSTSVWLMFADSDDNFLKGYYQTLFQFMDSDFDLIFFPPISTNENGEIGSRHLTYKLYFQTYWKYNKNEEKLRYKLEVIWSRLVKKSFVIQNKLRFDEIMSSNDKYFALSTGIHAKKIFVSENSIYSWNYRVNSLTTKITKPRFEDTVDVTIRSNNLLRDNLPFQIYRKNATTAIKLLGLSLFRNKFGIIYTFKLCVKLKRNGVPFFSFQDISRIRNFIRNNKYYTK